MSGKYIDELLLIKKGQGFSATLVASIPTEIIVFILFLRKSMVEVRSNKVKVELTKIICHIAQISRHLKRNFWIGVYLTA